MLTSCSENDTPVDANIMPSSKVLTGMYTVLLDGENGNIGANAYNMVLVAYDFKADGTGLWSELYFNDDDYYPFIGNGGEVGGQFTYTVDDDGNVSFIFEHPEFAPQRGTVISLDNDYIAFHHTADDVFYFGSLLDEESANYIRKLMTQFNGGDDKLLFEWDNPAYQIIFCDESCSLWNMNDSEAVDAVITFWKKSTGYYLEMNGGTVTLDNYTGIYDNGQPLFNGKDRDLNIILKGSSVIRVANPIGILTLGDVKLGGSGELKIITNAEGANHFGIQGANYGKDKAELEDLAYDSVHIKRLDKVINEDGTCTWTYIVGKCKTLAEVTKEDIGKPVSADGYVYPGLEDLKLFKGTFAGMLASVSGTGHGLIISSQISVVNIGYDDAVAKTTGHKPAIAGCEPWHLPTDVEAAEMVYACAGVESKPLVYEKSKSEYWTIDKANLVGCNVNKLSEKAAKVGIVKFFGIVVDKDGDRASMFENYIQRVDNELFHNLALVHACAKF